METPDQTFINKYHLDNYNWEQVDKLLNRYQDNIKHDNIRNNINCNTMGNFRIIHLL
jgi:hypothetical protein